jgi:hypothetical protein
MPGDRGRMKTMRLLPFAAAAGRGCITNLEGSGCGGAGHPMSTSDGLSLCP